MTKVTAVEPLTPLAPYTGGKRFLARHIIRRIDAVPHDCYAEAFVGMGGVFLRRHQAPKSEIINDYSRDVATFFRVLQRHYVAFVDMMCFHLTTRVEFERLVATDPETLTDLERAARFFYLQNTAFGGKVTARNFGVAPGRPARFDITRLGTILEEVHSRLARVVIECLPYEEFITRYDRPGQRRRLWQEHVRPPGLHEAGDPPQPDQGAVSVVNQRSARGSRTVRPVQYRVREDHLHHERRHREAC